MAAPSPEDVAAVAGVTLDAVKIILASSGANRDPKKKDMAARNLDEIARASGHSRTDCGYVMAAYDSLI